MQSNNQQPRYFSDLDGMRGALACLVMLMHFGIDHIISLVSHGSIQKCEWDLSVDFFFVLSGFVLARSFRRKLPAWDQYFVKRIFRLAPMFILTLLVVLACGVRADALTKLANLLIVQSILGLDSLNYPSWSIPFELLFPALYLMIGPGWSRSNGTIKGTIFVITLLVAMVCAYGLAIGADHRLARAFVGLSLGMVLYDVAGHKVSAFRASPLQVWLLFAASLGVMLVAHRFPPAALLFHPLVVTIILSGALSESVFSTVPFQALGRWSYSIYLLHIPVLMATMTMLGNDAFDHRPMAKLILAAITIVLASISYRFVERPMIQLADRWVRRRLTTMDASSAA